MTTNVVIMCERRSILAKARKRVVMDLLMPEYQSPDIMRVDCVGEIKIPSVPGGLTRDCSWTLVDPTLTKVLPGRCESCPEGTVEIYDFHHMTFSGMLTVFPKDKRFPAFLPTQICYFLTFLQTKGEEVLRDDRNPNFFFVKDRDGRPCVLDVGLLEGHPYIRHFFQCEDFTVGIVDPDNKKIGRYIPTLVAGRIFLFHPDVK